MVFAYSTINLWFYTGLLYYRLDQVGLIVVPYCTISLTGFYKLSRETLPRYISANVHTSYA